MGVRCREGGGMDKAPYPLLSPFIHLDLPRQALEEGRGPHDRVGDVPCRLQVCLKLQLCLLELEQRLLDTDGGEQHEVARALLASDVQDILGGLQRAGEAGRQGGREAGSEEVRGLSLT